MKIDVENLIEIIENAYPTLKFSGYWKDLLKLILKDGQDIEGMSEVPESDNDLYKANCKIARLDGENFLLKRTMGNLVESFKYMGWVNGLTEEQYAALEKAAEMLDETPTPESWWPTEEQIEQAGKDCAFNMYDVVDGEEVPWCNNKREGDIGVKHWKAAIQWLQTSAGTREAELEKCLGELVEWSEEYHSPKIYPKLNAVVDKAKSLLSKTI